MIKHHKQQGGTLLGLVIGLIVGLAIAVVVALAITKTSLPFVTKPGKADKPADTSTSQTADPNKPIYGSREPAKEAAREFAKSNDTNTPVLVPAADKKPESAGDNQQDDKLAADKVKKSDKQDAKAAEPKGVEHKEPAKDVVAKADSTDDKWIYYLQAGAFREAGDAENARAKLALLGFEARVAERPSENGALYRVRLGPFSQIETMNRVRAKLSENGVDVAVVRNPK
jgi:cell division protein FtsN